MPTAKTFLATPDATANEAAGGTFGMVLRNNRGGTTRSTRRGAAAPDDDDDDGADPRAKAEGTADASASRKRKKKRKKRSATSTTVKEDKTANKGKRRASPRATTTSKKKKTKKRRRGGEKATTDLPAAPETTSVSAAGTAAAPPSFFAELQAVEASGRAAASRSRLTATYRFPFAGFATLAAGPYPTAAVERNNDPALDALVEASAARSRARARRTTGAAARSSGDRPAAPDASVEASAARSSRGATGAAHASTVRTRAATAATATTGAMPHVPATLDPVLKRMYFDRAKWENERERERRARTRTAAAMAATATATATTGAMSHGATTTLDPVLKQMYFDRAKREENERERQLLVRMRQSYKDAMRDEAENPPLAQLRDALSALTDEQFRREMELERLRRALEYQRPQQKTDKNADADGDADVRPRKRRKSAVWDQRWNDKLDELRKFKAEMGHCNVSRTHNKNLAVWCTTQRQYYNQMKSKEGGGSGNDEGSGSGEGSGGASEGGATALTDERIRALESLGFAWKSRTAFDDNFELLKRYREVHGNTDVPRGYKDDDARHHLGAWVRRVREQHRRRAAGRPSKLEDEHVSKLESIGFCWEESQPPNRFDENIERLKRYKEKHGDTLVPTDYDAEKGFGRWVSTIRNQCRRRSAGKEHTLTEEQVEKLRSVGFDIEGDKRSVSRQSSKQDRAWYDMLEKLKAYKEEKGGDVNALPRNYEADGKKLGLWCHTQRQRCKDLAAGKETFLFGEERLEALREIGFDITGGVKRGPRQQTANARWESMYQDLVAYHAVRGHCDVSRTGDDKANYPNLGRWVDTQRQAYKKRQTNEEGHLTDERVKRLAAIGFKFTLRCDWEERFRQLESYKTEHGHCRVPVDSNFGRWVKRQRQGKKYGQGWLDDVKIARLDGIGFEWILRERKARM